MMKNNILFFLLAAILSSCVVSKKHLIEANRKIAYLKADSTKLATQRLELIDANQQLWQEKNDLTQQLENELKLSKEKSKELEDTKKIVFYQQEKLQKISVALEQKKNKLQQVKEALSATVEHFLSNDVRILLLEDVVKMQLKDSVLNNADFPKDAFFATISQILQEHKDLCLVVKDSARDIADSCSLRGALSFVCVLSQQYQVSPSKLLMRISEHTVNSNQLEIVFFLKESFL